MKIDFSKENKLVFEINNQDQGLELRFVIDLPEYSLLFSTEYKNRKVEINIPIIDSLKESTDEMNCRIESLGPNGISIPLKKTIKNSLWENPKDFSEIPTSELLWDPPPGGNRREEAMYISPPPVRKKANNYYDPEDAWGG